MMLVPIQKNEFPIWREMRECVYESLSNGFHDKEMSQIIKSEDWHCLFIKDNGNKILGFVELSSRNIVDGCLSSPVAYIEGLFIKKENRGNGLGTKTIEAIKIWCKERGFTELGADTELANKRAQKFFNSVGFHETFRIVEFRTKIN